MTQRSKHRAQAQDVQRILAAQMTLLREHGDLIRQLAARVEALEYAHGWQPGRLRAPDGGEPHQARPVDPHLGRF